MSKIKKLVLIGLAIRIGLSLISGYHPDIRNHVDWGKKLWQYGPQDFYENIFWGVSWPNQPLGSIYLFGFISKVQEILFGFLTYLNKSIGIFPSFIMPYLEKKLPFILVKLPFILAEVGIGYLVYKIIFKLVDDKNAAWFGAGLILFNPALIYNSAVWGQTDALINLLALIGIWSAWRKKYLLAFLAFLGSLYFKLSLLIWLPVFGLILLCNKNWIKKTLTFILTSIFYLLISLPFVHHGNVFTWLWYLYTNRVLPRQGDMLSGNAFNFWTMVFGVNLGLKESISFLGTTARKFGRFFYGLVAAVISGLSFIRQIKNRPKFSFYMLNLVILTMGAFLMMTNMHERYLYPLFAPLAVLVAEKYISKKIFILLTGVHLLNLYNLWWYPEISWIKRGLKWQGFLFPRIMSAGLIIIFLFFVYKFVLLVKSEK